jgi:hypothetical protein
MSVKSGSGHIITTGSTYISGCTPPNDAQTGQVYWDSNQQGMVVYDGGSWQPINQTTLMMPYETENAIDRMIELINKQDGLSAMADKYPLVKDALGQLEVALKLCQNLDND